jgi:hypothetical protein
MRTTVLGLFICLLCCLPHTAQAQRLNVPGSTISIEILDYGIYQTRRDPTKDVHNPNITTGKLNHVTDHQLIERTNIICARLNTTFGIDYVVKGGSVGALIPMTLITRFPPAGVVDDKGVKFASNQFGSTELIGRKSFRTFAFDEPYEMVPGPWAMEFHFDGKLVGAQHFIVRNCDPVS